jgi:hypothetical protein
MNTLIEYVRQGGNKKYNVVNGKTQKGTKGGIRKGVLVAVKLDNDGVRIGWSLCHTKAGDEFNPEFGYKAAYGRAIKVGSKPIPPSLQKKANAFKARVERYYKGSEVKFASEG